MELLLLLLLLQIFNEKRIKIENYISIKLPTKKLRKKPFPLFGLGPNFMKLYSIMCDDLNREPSQEGDAGRR